MNKLLLLLLIPFYIENALSISFDDYFGAFFSNDHETRETAKERDSEEISDDNFPSNTAINPCKVDITKNKDNQLVITLHTNKSIQLKDIRTKKDSRHVKVEITLDDQSYVIFLEENRVSLATACQQVVRNDKNTKYSSSSSSMSRQEILPHPIDLNSVKMNVKKDTGVVLITVAYKEPSKISHDIDIEFE
jgi:hypothetical protein